MQCYIVWHTSAICFTIHPLTWLRLGETIQRRTFDDIEPLEKRAKYDSNEITANGRSSPSRSLTVDAFSLTSSQEQSEEPSLELRHTPEPTTLTTATTATKSYEIEVDNEETQRKEEEQHKKSLFLYVFILRCIAYPFNSKQPTDMARRLCKVTPQQLDVIKDRFSAFLGGNSNIVADEAFFNAVQSYFEVFIRSPRIARMVESGGATAADFRDVFKNNIEKRIKNLPEIDGLSKDRVIGSQWTYRDYLQNPPNPQ